MWLACSSPERPTRQKGDRGSPRSPARAAPHHQAASHRKRAPIAHWRRSRAFDHALGYDLLLSSLPPIASTGARPGPGHRILGFTLIPTQLAGSLLGASGLLAAFLAAVNLWGGGLCRHQRHAARSASHRARRPARDILKQMFQPGHGTVSDRGRDRSLSPPSLDPTSCPACSTA